MSEAVSSLDTLQTSERSCGWRAINAWWQPENNEGESWLHRGWMPTRKRVAMALHLTGQSQERQFRFRACGREAYVAVDRRNRGNIRVLSNHCGDRLCQVCGNLRSYRLRAALMRKIHGKHATFLTLTVGGDRSNLRKTIDHLYQSFARLRRSPLWKKRVYGGAAFLEIHYSEKSQQWHPHLHIVMMSEYIDQGILSQAWKAATGDSFIVDIRRIRQDKLVAYYVTKYASKPLDGSFTKETSLLCEAIVALKGRRLCLTFGDWYGCASGKALESICDDELRDNELSAENWYCVGTLDSVRTRALAGDSESLRIYQIFLCRRERQKDNATPSLFDG